ncbi:MAG: patatin-like phospholipase family protein [Rhizobacter sp.]|nr:patatin-like phospholipase family protein [Rhizobacter sp.]
MAEPEGAEDTTTPNDDAAPAGAADAPPPAPPPDAGTSPDSGCEVHDALAQERSHIDALRARDGQAHRLNPLGEPVGLALSGGGIRSATLCLGAIQALAEGRLLRRFDYLSTVSGGGYIGCWFSAILRRQQRSGFADPIGDIEKLLSPSEIRKKDAEPAELAFLRAYSNYLTPRLGLFSADTLAAVIGYLRNLLLSLLLAVFSAGLVLAVLHLFMTGVASLPGRPLLLHGLDIAARIVLGCSAVFASLLLTLQSLDVRVQISDGKYRDFLLQALHVMQDVYGRFMLPLVAAGLLLAGLVLEAALPFRLPWQEVAEVSGWALVTFGLGAVLAYIVIDLAARMRDSIELLDVVLKTVLSLWNLQARLVQVVSDQWRESLRYVLATGACAVVGWQLIDLCGRLLPAHPAVAMFRGPALAVAVACVVFMVWLGAVGTTYTELTREWMSRLLGTLVGVTLAWLTVGALLINARPMVVWLGSGRWLLALQAAWILPTAGFLLLATLLVQRRPGPVVPGRLWQLMVPLSCGVVTLLFMAAMTVAFQEALTRTAGTSALREVAGRDSPELLQAHLHELGQAMNWHTGLPPEVDAAELWPRTAAWCEVLWTTMPVLSLLLVSLLGATLAFRYIDVNVFSLQNLYRNRLVRCYLGAARHDQRLQNPYAGFDPADDIELSSLAQQRPYHLINTALNITQGDDLAWQQRKAAAFCFSPLWSGYWLEAADLATAGFGERTRGGYAKTAEYALEPVGSGLSQGVMLGTAMATSGAAVSSQMGFASRGLLAFVLTLFNVRLGRWFPNTTGAAMRRNLGRHSPRYAGAWYLSELLGRTNEKSAWVYLSDGGHFDNLGVYELVRRRCRFIVVVDAGADPAMSFGDLGNCVRKCRVDFGVNIRLDLGEFNLQGKPPRPAVSHVTGKVYYPSVGGQPQFEGDIVYIKSSLPTTGDRPPADIVSFQCDNPLFPHQPTTDQWFTEAQFESYRQLGYWITKRALTSVREVFERIERPKP